MGWAGTDLVIPLMNGTRHPPDCAETGLERNSGALLAMADGTLNDVSLIGSVRNFAETAQFEQMFKDAVAAGSPPAHWGKDGVHPSGHGQGLMASRWLSETGLA